MARKVEDWWAGNYPELSIKNYKKMSVYLAFIKHRNPFFRENKRFQEAFWIIDNCDIYEWFDLLEKTGEKFGHDRNSDTYFYEYWWVLPEKVRKVRKVWFCDPVEWGVEIAYYPEFELIDSWSVKNGEVLVESYKKSPSHTEGKRFGTALTPDGPEEFSEDFWEDKEKVRIEREWKNPLGQEFKKVTEELKKNDLIGFNDAKGKGLISNLGSEMMEELFKESLRTLQKLNRLGGKAENDPEELCAKLELGANEGLGNFRELVNAEIEKQKKVDGLGKVGELQDTLVDLETNKLRILEKLSEIAGNQDLGDINSEVSKANSQISNGLPEEIDSNLQFFKETDEKLNNLLASTIQALKEKEAEKLEIFIQTTIENEELLTRLNLIDSQASNLLQSNIDRTTLIDPDLASKSSDLNKQIEEIPTSTAGNLMSRIQKRLDLLSNLEKAAYDDLLKKLKEYEDRSNDWEQEKKDLSEKVKNLEEELKKAQEEVLVKDFELKNKEDELRDKDYELESKMNELDSVKSSLEQKSKALDEAQNLVNLKNAELNDKNRQLNDLKNNLDSKESELQSAKDQISGLNSELQQSKEDLQKHKEDSQKLSVLLDSQKSQIETQKQLLENSADKNSETLQKIAEDAGQKSKALAEALNDLENLKKRLEDSNSLNSHLQSQLKSANDEISSLKSSLASLSEAHQKSQFRNILKIFKNNQSKLFKKWLDRTKNIEKNNLMYSDEEFDFSDEEEEKELVKEYKAADELIIEENRYLIENNIIMQSYKLIEGKTEKPMSYINIFKFLEELVQSKYETDKKDIKDLRQMRSMTEFMMESLQRKFGIQSLALKFLGQFIPGFFQLFNEGHKYAVYYSRLLQLFHPEPVSYSLSLYLVKINSQFAELIEKCDRFMSNHKISLQKSTSKTHGLKAYEEASTGGLALVSDVIDFIYTIFAGDKDSGTKALEIMKPELVSIEEYVIFRICHKMAKMGVTAETIFNTLDKDGSGSISSKELVIGIKKDLELWISEGNINKLMEHLDVDGTNTLSLDEFTSRINMKTFLEWTKKPVWTITKCSFLIAMIEVYKYNQRKLAAHLNPKFLKYGKSEIDKEIFDEILLSYEPGLNVYDLEKLYSEGIETVPGCKGVNFRVLTLLMSKYGFGSLKSFKIKELMENLAIRKMTVDINLGITEVGQQTRVRRSGSNPPEEEKKNLMRVPTTVSKDKSKSPCPVDSDKRKIGTPVNREYKKLSTESFDEDSKGKKISAGLPPPAPPSIGESPSMIGKKRVAKK